MHDKFNHPDNIIIPKLHAIYENHEKFPLLIKIKIIVSLKIKNDKKYCRGKYFHFFHYSKFSILNFFLKINKLTPEFVFFIIYTLYNIT